VGLEVCALLGSKGADLRRCFGIDAQELELGGWNLGRNQYCTIVLKRDVASIKQMIDVRREQQTVVSIQPLVTVGARPPRFYVAGSQ
jgi:hypothetical protein